MKTIPVAAAQLSGASSYEIPYGPIAAATVLGTLPLVLLVLFFQRKIVSRPYRRSGEGGESILDFRFWILDCISNLSIIFGILNNPKS